MKENNYPGNFIVVEGPDGAGTTTQSKKLAEDLGAEWTSEPTSGMIGEKLEEMIRSEDYSAQALALAFAADRLVHIEEKVVPLLKEGEDIVSDRYLHSSLVYQPAMGADFDWVKQVNKDALRPDLAIVLDVSSEEAMERINFREETKFSEKDIQDSQQTRLPTGTDVIFENLSFQQEVAARYKEIVSQRDDTISIDGSKPIDDVFEKVQEIVAQRLGF